MESSQTMVSIHQTIVRKPNWFTRKANRISLSGELATTPNLIQTLSLRPRLFSKMLKYMRLTYSYRSSTLCSVQTRRAARKNSGIPRKYKHRTTSWRVRVAIRLTQSLWSLGLRWLRQIRRLCLILTSSTLRLSIRLILPSLKKEACQGPMAR